MTSNQTPNSLNMLRGVGFPPGPMRPALGFFAALGFTPDAGPGSRKLYGVPAFVDWDGPGEDHVLLERAISGQ